MPSEENAERNTIMKIRMRRRLQALTAILCTFILTLSVLPVFADDIESYESTTSILQGQLNSIYAELDEISAQIEQTERDIEVTNGEIERTKENLETAQAEEDAQYEDMKARIKYIYEAGDYTFLEMLFSAESMSDFLNRAEFIQNVSEYDRQMLDELQATRQRIENEHLTLQEQQASLEELQQELTAKEADLEARANATAVSLAAYRQYLAQAQANGTSAGGAGTGGAGQTVTDGSVVYSGTPMSVSDYELKVLAAIMDCEAYPVYNYMLAVATVVLNRVEDPRFPNNIVDVIDAPGQFRPVSTGKMARILAEGPSELALQVARDAVNGARLAEVSDCFFFLYAPSTSRKGVNVGNNLFFASW